MSEPGHSVCLTPSLWLTFVPPGHSDAAELQLQLNTARSEFEQAKEAASAQLMDKDKTASSRIWIALSPPFLHARSTHDHCGVANGADCIRGVPGWRGLCLQAALKDAQIEQCVSRFDLASHCCYLVRSR